MQCGVARSTACSATEAPPLRQSHRSALLGPLEWRRISVSQVLRQSSAADRRSRQRKSPGSISSAQSCQGPARRKRGRSDQVDAFWRSGRSCGSCLVVLRHARLQEERPSSYAAILPFAQVERFTESLTRLLGSGGLLALWNVHFRLADMAAASCFSRCFNWSESARQSAALWPERQAAR